jgi:hypothetical protein
MDGICCLRTQSLKLLVARFSAGFHIANMTGITLQRLSI